MAEHVYKVVELVGSSKTGIEDAVQNALTKAAQSIRNMRWFEVVETRGYIEDLRRRILAGYHQARLHRGRPRIGHE